MTLGFTGMVLGGKSPRQAWEEIERGLRADEHTQQLIRELATTPDGRALLDDSRRGWGAQGFDAPFEFIFKEAEGQDKE